MFLFGKTDYRFLPHSRDNASPVPNKAFLTVHRWKDFYHYRWSLFREEGFPPSQPTLSTSYRHKKQNFLPMRHARLSLPIPMIHSRKKPGFPMYARRRRQRPTTVLFSYKTGNTHKRNHLHTVTPVPNKAFPAGNHGKLPVRPKHHDNYCCLPWAVFRHLQVPSISIPYKQKKQNHRFRLPKPER